MAGVAVMVRDKYAVRLAQDRYNGKSSNDWSGLAKTQPE